jgi:acyl carrier protein
MTRSEIAQEIMSWTPAERIRLLAELGFGAAVIEAATDQFKSQPPLIQTKVFDEVCEILSNQTGFRIVDMELDTKFTAMDVDSLDAVELVMAMEEGFNIGDVSDEEAEKLTTIGEACRFIEDRLQGKR